MNALLLAYLGNALLDTQSSEGVQRWFADLMHEDDGVRDAVRVYLLRVGDQAVPSLVRLLDHANPSVQNWASQLLIEIGEPAVDALRKLDSAAAPSSLRTCAQRVLRRMRCA